MISPEQPMPPEPSGEGLIAFDSEAVAPSDEGLIMFTSETIESAVVTDTPKDEGPAHRSFDEYVRYNALRYAANAEWAAAIGAGIIAEVAGAPTPLRAIVAGAVGFLATLSERKQTDYAARKKAEAHEAAGTTPIEAPSVPKEVISLGLTAWQGAGPSIEVNDAIGLPNTPRRNHLHALAYGTIMAAWASPALTEAGKAGIDQFVNNPVRSTAVTLVGGTAGKFGLNKLAKVFRRMHIKQDSPNAAE